MSIKKKFNWILCIDGSNNNYHDFCLPSYQSKLKDDLMKLCSPKEWRLESAPMARRTNTPCMIFMFIIPFTAAK